MYLDHWNIRHRAMVFPFVDTLFLLGITKHMLVHFIGVRDFQWAYKSHPYVSPLTKVRVIP